MSAEKAWRETRDVLFQRYIGVDLQETSEVEDEDFRNGVVNCKDSVSYGSILELGVGRKDTVLMVMFAGAITSFWI